MNPGAVARRCDAEFTNGIQLFISVQKNRVSATVLEHIVCMGDKLKANKDK
jgi:hypothetical protein